VRRGAKLIFQVKRDRSKANRLDESRSIASAE
jgi:hypothetical protein